MKHSQTQINTNTTSMSNYGFQRSTDFIVKRLRHTQSITKIQWMFVIAGGMTPLTFNLESLIEL